MNIRNYSPARLQETEKCPEIPQCGRITYVTLPYLSYQINVVNKTTRKDKNAQVEYK